MALLDDGGGITELGPPDPARSPSAVARQALIILAAGDIAQQLCRAPDVAWWRL